MANKKYLTKEDKNRSLAINNSRYWKTPKGKLVMTYNNMSRRVRGYVKPHLYKGLKILNRQIFYSWAESNLEYISIYEKWVASDYERKLSPSIDRVDSSLGYTLDNIRWLTHSENSRIGAINKHLILNNGS